MVIWMANDVCGELFDGTKKCNASERDDLTEEQLQCKQQYLYTPLGTLSPASLSQWPCSCTEFLLQIHA